MKCNCGSRELRDKVALLEEVFHEQNLVITSLMTKIANNRIRTNYVLELELSGASAHEDEDHFRIVESIQRQLANKGVI